jgi:4-hydroxy-3-methylbut-2-enyl diphosphate reductase
MSKSAANLKVAKSAGFCPGVKKAIDTVLTLAQENNVPIYTLGPLIHNRHVIETLKAKNIHAINSLSEIKNKKAVLVIRAHGITPQFERQVRSLNMKVIDATCPLVKNAQGLVEKYAGLEYSTVIVGDAGHAEVTGLLGYTRGKGYIVANSTQARKLPSLDKVNIVAQTTQDEKNFEETSKTICTKSKKCVISNTICFPTKERQKETAELAKSADLIIVVGGQNSANTARLAKLCSKYCSKTVHVESEKDLDKESVKNAGKIAITAGASTPGWITERVADYVKDLKKPHFKYVLKIIADAWEFVIGSGLYSAFAALSLTYVSMKVQAVKVESRVLFLAGFFVLGLTVINRAWQITGPAGKDKEWLFVKHKFFSTAIGFILGICAILISFGLGIKIFILLMLFFVLGAVYPARGIFKIRGMSAFPASKDIVTALGWAFVCAPITVLYLAIEFTMVNYLTFFYCVVLVFIRSVLLGISAVHSDLIVGRETLYKVLGRKKSAFVLAGAFSTMIMILLYIFAVTFNFLILVLLAGNFYVAALMIFYFKSKVPKNTLAEALVDGQFLLLAFLTYIAN